MMMSFSRSVPALVLTVCWLLPLSCSTSGAGPRSGGARVWDGKVEVYGAMHAMMHEGRTDAAVRLDALTPDKELIALGAIEDLAGEITVAGGLVHIARPTQGDGASYHLMQESGVGAALLVTARVPSWQTFRIDRRLRLEDLDAEVARFADLGGLPPDGRFPFLIEGPFENLRLHVVDGRRLPHAESTHQDHVATAIRTTLPEARGTLVGFFSRNDQGVFTHMGSMTHIHAAVHGTRISGHVDDVVVPEGRLIRLPVPGPR